MTNAPVEVITSVQRRRRWPRAEKERIVAAALQPGAVASEVARVAGIHTSQLFRWRQQLCSAAAASAAFSPVAIVPDAASAAVAAPSTIEIEFARGLGQAADPHAMTAGPATRRMALIDAGGAKKIGLGRGRWGRWS
jgi:transposase